jgi:hypothetical protein
MRFVKLAVLFVLAAILPMAVAQGPNLTVIQYNSNINPCQSTSIVKSSVVVAQSTATTTALVAAVAGKTTYVCGFYATFSGTTPALTFKTGTQTTTACDTATASLTGTFLPTSGSYIGMGGPGTLFQSIASGQLCVTSVASAAVSGVLVYVQM